MAEPKQPGFSDIITFDIFDESDCDNNQIMVGHLTQEEEEEIHNVVSLLDSVNSKELIDFTSHENNIRHKPINLVELDRLAGKNNAITTNYQTKWALAVLRS